MMSKDDEITAAATVDSVVVVAATARLESRNSIVLSLNSLLP
jgi:hypothetical protein